MKTINKVGENAGKVILYTGKNNKIQLEVQVEKETVWLTQKQPSILFGTKRPAITKHLSNIFKSWELKENSVCSILEHTAAEGKTYKTAFYNLDALALLTWLDGWNPEEFNLKDVVFESPAKRFRDSFREDC